MTLIKVFFALLTALAIYVTLLPESEEQQAKRQACAEATKYWQYTKTQYAFTPDKSDAAKTTIDAFNKMHALCD